MLFPFVPRSFVAKEWIGILIDAETCRYRYESVEQEIDRLPDLKFRRVSPRNAPFNSMPAMLLLPIDQKTTARLAP